MSPSGHQGGHANSREHLRQAIDTQIQSLEASVRALKLRRNALSPVSSLPPEIFAAIFSLLCLPALQGDTSDHHQARLCVSHVCHQWREIALNQPFLWSNVDLAALSSAGVAEIFARAKSVPLFLEASVPGGWNDVRSSTFQKELQARVPYACHLSISGEIFDLHETLGGLVLPAPTLKYLSLFCRGGYHDTETGDHLSIPDTLFNGSAPRLSRLKLFNCEISWKSPLLKGLRHLEMRSPNPSPTLAAWLDALEELSRLKTLVLHEASPVARRGDVERNATLPSLTHLEISDDLMDCVRPLAHLDLPVLTALSVKVSFYFSNSNDVQVLLPHLVRHASGPQDTRPLQSVLLHRESHGTKILAWPVPDIDVMVQDPPTFLATTALPSPRVALYFKSIMSDGNTCLEILDAAMAALPLSGLVTLLAQDFPAPPDKGFWLRHAPKWPLLRRAQLEAPAQQGFKKMLLEGNNESPLLPLFTELVLVGVLEQDWAFALRKRVDQGVPLELLDLRMCVMPSAEEVTLLGGIVADALGPENTSRTRERMVSRWKAVVCGPFTEKLICFDGEDETYTNESRFYEQ